MKNSFLIALSTSLLASCGFTPMYGDYSASDQVSAKQSFAQIEIDNIPDREGQFLRNELIDRLNMRGHAEAPRYQLSFSKLGIDTRDLDLTKDSEATRGQLTASTTMRLIDKQNGEVVLTRPLRSISSYNILQSNFATRVTENNAEETAIKDLARQAEQQLALYFNR